MLEALGWGAFLACSWTWCIGMFLPVILIRDFGWAGFVAFALPNIAGAALFGAALSRDGASERFVSSHRTLVWLFSVVTIAFQAFFAGSLLQPAPLNMEQLALLLVAATMAIGIHLLTARPVLLRAASILTWLVSASLMILAANRGHEGPPVEIARAPVDHLALAGLGLVCAFGFSFCPYLDRTFHDARQQLKGRAGTGAFIFGFCILFAVMITFTVLYAREGTFAAIPIGGDQSIPLVVALSPIVLAHIAVQLGFTIGAHLPWAVREAPADRPASPGSRARLWILGPAIAGLILSMAAASSKSALGLTGFELVYRAFLAFYGLVFPAYVWLCATPLGAGAAPTPRALKVWLGAMLLASPFYWTGFMQREYQWLLVGVAIVVLAKLAVGRSGRVAE